MRLADRVAVAVINYQTPDLTETAVRSFRHFYRDVRLLVIDNGSQDESPATIKELSDELEFTALFVEENRYHGPAMDLAMNQVAAPYVFMLDSDTETKKAGFLEEMLRLCEPSEIYGAGKVVHVNHRGFSVPKGIPVLASAHMLLSRETYLTLPPFVHHGLPALDNFKAAAEGGYRLASFPVGEYIDHLGRGTADRFGYGLGLKSRFDYLLNRFGF